MHQTRHSGVARDLTRLSSGLINGFSAASHRSGQARGRGAKRRLNEVFVGGACTSRATPPSTSDGCYGDFAVVSSFLPFLIIVLLKKGKVSFVSVDVLHRLHYLIFILAIVHAATCTLTVVLGKVKINQWRKWEESIRSKNHFDEGNGEKVIDLHSLTFFKERFEGVDANKRNYVISFFKHLCGIVTKADYGAMRMGFVMAHFNGDPRFHFHKYMVYAYEADFKKVVSINWFLWLLAVISLSLNVAGWHIYTWISIVPLLLLLVVGTKLEQVITELAIYVAQRHTVVVGPIKIQPSDEYFWFKKPKIILTTIHLILFLNSFGLAVFIWTWSQFGFRSCIMGDAIYVYPRMVLLVLVQTICSYSTLPLYAVVTQMGSTYNQEAMERYGSGLAQSSRQSVSDEEGANAPPPVVMTTQ